MKWGLEWRWNYFVLTENEENYISNHDEIDVRRDDPRGETTVKIHVVPASFEKDDGTNENDLPTESKVIK